MSDWTYKNKPIKHLDDFENSDKIVGFIYKITRISDGKAYWGKKSLAHSRKTRITKKERLLTPTRKVFKRVVKDSGWLNYWGSSLLLKEDIAKLGQDKFKREILELCYSKKYLTYAELSYQVKNNVLEIDSYNANILCKFYRKDVINKPNDS